jgi:hypothetical protein
MKLALAREPRNRPTLRQAASARPLMRNLEVLNNFSGIEIICKL